MSYWSHRIKYGPIFKYKHHLCDIKMHSLKQYNDFWESRICRFLMWTGLLTGNYDSPIGIELWLSSEKDFDEKELIRMEHSHNLRILASRCKVHLFQKAKGFGSKVGTFLGILVTHEDYYYILMDKWGNKWYESCVGKLEFMKDGDTNY